MINTRIIKDVATSSTIFYFLLLIVAASIFYFRVLYWVGATADPLLHNDSIEYLKGYQYISIKGLDLEGLREFFGRDTEILLPILYYISQFFLIIGDEIEIIYLNTIIFLFVYTLAIFNIFFHGLRNLKIKSKFGAASYYWFIIFLSVVPPGVSMQIARQAISFAFFILVMPLVIKRWSFASAGAAGIIMSLMHAGSTITALLMSAFTSEKISISKVALLMGVTSTFFYFDVVNIVFNFTQAEFKSHDPARFTYSMVLNLMVFFAILIGNKSINNKKERIAILLLIIYLLFEYQFFIARVFFGFDFFLLPFAILIFYLKTIQKSIFWLKSVSFISIVYSTIPVFISH